MKDRQSYLTKYWAKYPESTCDESNTLAYGELTALEFVNGKLHLTICEQGKTQILGAANARMIDADFEAQNVLSIGDKISLRKADEGIIVSLLAPQLAQSPFQREIHLEILSEWNRFLQEVRTFWIEQKFVELSTPTLVTCPGFESTITPMQVVTSQNARPRFLPTSPEIHLKKALANGMTRIFEIRSCFRDGELGPHHQPEFTMLEWYRAYRNFEQLKMDLTQLLKHLKQKSLIEGELAHIRSLTVRECFQMTFEFSLSPRTTVEELKNLAFKAIDHRADLGESWTDLFHRLWVSRVDPWLATFSEPIYVTHFPPSEAALARINKEGWAERGELYWRGLEISNGYHELNDPAEQRHRAEKSPHFGHDEEFFTALECGMPPSIGMALGLERLFMAAKGLREIRELKFFPYSKA